MDDRHINTEFRVAPEGSGLQEILGAILRRKWILLGTIAGVVLAGLLVLSQVVPAYTAQGMVLIEAQETNFGAINAVAPGLPGDAASVQSEAYILFSGNLARRVIDKLKLLDDPEFQDAEIAASQIPGPSASAGNEELAGEDHEQSVAYKVAADRFASRLAVQPQDNSRVIAVNFISESPDKARTIVNTLLDEYILSRIEAKYESTKRANVWLSQRTAELREKVESSESNVEILRKQYGLLEGNGATLSSQEMAEINTQLIVARTERSEAESRLGELKRLVASASGIRTASEVLDSPLIQRLREQQAGIERDIAELSTEFGPKHPRMVQLRAQSDDVSNKIADEVYKTIDGLQNEASMARARESSLGQRLEKLKEQVADANENSIAVRAAEREAEANRILLANLLARQSEAVSQEDLDFQQADARIISYADIPLEPSYPNKVAVVALLFVGSTVLGLLLILLVESMDRGVRSGEDLYAETGVPSLGFSPLTPSMQTDETLSVFAAVRHSAFGQSMKTLDWSIKLASRETRPPKTIMITSSVPQEGKSTIACCLAYNQAATGSRVLLIDADMRRPSIYKKAGLDSGEGFAALLRGTGLAGVLQGKASFEDVIVRSGHSNLYIIPAGKESNFDSEMLVSSDAMEKLLERAKEEFDTIVLDTPPVMACADARILSSKVDATVFVVRWGTTKLSVVKLAISQLASAGAKFAGSFLSMVNIKNYTTYNYGDVVAYSGDMARYYSGSPESKKRVVPLVPQQNPAD